MDKHPQDITPFGAEVVVAERYTHDQEQRNMQEIALLLGIGYGQLPVIIWIFLALHFPRLTFAIAALVWMWYYRILGRMLQERATQFNKFGRGAQGEEILVERLRRHLDHRWTIFTSLQLPVQKGDIDMVLVGPGGVYVIEVKHPRRNESGVSQIGDYRETAKTHKRKLRRFLEQHDITTEITPVVALATEIDPTIFTESTVAVWMPSTLQRDATVLQTTHTLAEADVTAIRALLRTTVEALQRDRYVPPKRWTRLVRRFLLPADIRGST